MKCISQECALLGIKDDPEELKAIFDNTGQNQGDFGFGDDF